MSILEGKKVIHFIGCGGSGMFPIIQILHGKGYTITGSDVNEGDIIVANKNFGCGSSREHAPIAIKAAGVSCVIAETFARIFYRNATNVGVPLLEAPGVSELIEDGEEIEVDMEKGLIISESGKEIEFKKLPPFMLEILESGGLINYLKNQKNE